MKNEAYELLFLIILKIKKRTLCMQMKKYLKRSKIFSKSNLKIHFPFLRGLDNDANFSKDISKTRKIKTAIQKVNRKPTLFFNNTTLMDFLRNRIYNVTTEYVNFYCLIISSTNKTKYGQNENS